MDTDLLEGGLGQLLFPGRLSADYSFPQESIPDSVVSFESIAGGLLLVLPPGIGLFLWVKAMLEERRHRSRGAATEALANGSSLLSWIPLIVFALMWAPLSYFPQSNIPTLLPTIRAERLWYLPAIGTSVGLALAAVWLLDRTRHVRNGLPAILGVGAFLLVHCVQARAHALDYSDELSFWAATREASPRSAKAHLNYSTMWVPLGRHDLRLEPNLEALELAPEWPKANVYLGDTLCHLQRFDEAWEPIIRGLRLDPEGEHLITMGLRCLLHSRLLVQRKSELSALAREYPETWLSHYIDNILNEMAAKAGGPSGNQPNQEPKPR